MHSQSISAGPALVKYKFALTCNPPLLSGQRSLLLDLPGGTFIQQAEITQLLQASIGSPKHSGRSASSWTTPAPDTPRVLLLQRRITTPTSDQTPAPGSALHAHPHQQPTYRVRFPLLGLPSGQTQVRGLPQLILWQQVLYFNSTGGAHTGAIASADVGSPTTSPNSHAPLDTPHSVPAAGIRTPRPGSTCNYCLRLSPAHQQHCSKSRNNLKFQQPGAIFNNLTRARFHGNALQRCQRGHYILHQ